MNILFLLALLSQYDAGGGGGFYDATETYISGAGVCVGDLDLNGNDLLNVNDVELISITSAITSSGVKIGGMGVATSESITWKFGETGNIVDVSTATGVTSVDFGAIGLAGGSYDASDGNLTNIGTAQIDGLICDSDANTAYDLTAGTYAANYTSDGTAGPIEIAKQVSASPADGDVLWEKRIVGKNSTPGDYIYGKIINEIQDKTAGSEESITRFYVSEAAGALVEYIRIDGTDGQTNVYVSRKLFGYGLDAEDQNATNFGDLALDSLSPDGTNIGVTIGAGVLQIGDGIFSWDHAPMVGIEGATEIDGILYADGAITTHGTTATKGQSMTIDSVTMTCTFPGGGAATCVTAASIPFGASVLQVTGRQTTPSTTCTTCTAGADMGSGLDVDQYGSALECDVDNTQYTTATATANVMGSCLLAGGCTITMTAVGGNCVDGVTAWTVHYITGTAATSD